MIMRCGWRRVWQTMVLRTKRKLAAGRWHPLGAHACRRLVTIMYCREIIVACGCEMSAGEASCARQARRIRAGRRVIRRGLEEQRQARSQHAHLAAHGLRRRRSGLAPSRLKRGCGKARASRKQQKKAPSKHRFMLKSAALAPGHGVMKSRRSIEGIVGDADFEAIRPVECARLACTGGVGTAPHRIRVPSMRPQPLSRKV